MKTTDDVGRCARFEKLLAFVQGASWALALAGSMYLFLLFLPFGFILASMIASICFLFAIVVVIVCEVGHIHCEKLHELQQQTHLLKQLTTSPNHQL